MKTVYHFQEHIEEKTLSDKFLLFIPLFGFFSSFYDAGDFFNSKCSELNSFFPHYTLIKAWSLLIYQLVTVFGIPLIIMIYTYK